MRRTTPPLAILVITALVNLWPIGGHPAAAAQQQEPARELSQLIFPNSAYDAQIQLMSGPFVEMAGKSFEAGLKRKPGAEETERLKNIVIRNLRTALPRADWDAEWAAMLREMFSPSELNELLAFYRSPIGRKLQRTAPDMQARTLAIATKLSQAPLTLARVPLETRSAMEKEFPGFASPVPPPVNNARSIKPPVKTRDVRPVYPKSAQDARIQGSVVIEAAIGADGKTTSMKILQSIPELDQAALDAVKQWEWSPAIVDGVPTPVTMTVSVSFSLK